MGDRLLTLASDIGISLTDTERIISKIIEVSSKIFSILVKIIDYINPVDLLDNIITLLGKLLNYLETFAKKAIDSIKEFISYATNIFTSFVQTIKDSGIVTKILDKISKAFVKFKDVISNLFETKNQNGNSTRKSRGLKKNVIEETLDNAGVSNSNEVLEQVKEQSDFVKALNKLLEAMIPLWESVKKIGVVIVNLVTVGINAISGFLQTLANLTNRLINYKTDNIGKLILIIGSIVLTLSLLAVLILRIADRVAWLRLLFKPLQGIGTFLDSLGGYFDGLNRKLTIGAIANLVKQIGLSMLMISASFLIFEQVKDGWWKAAIVLASLIAMVIVVATSVKTLNTEFQYVDNTINATKSLVENTQDAIKTIGKGFKFNRTTTALMGIAFLIKSIGTSMLEIAIAFKLLQNIDKQGLIIGFSILGIMIAATLLLSIFSNKLTNASPNFRKAYPWYI